MVDTAHGTSMEMSITSDTGILLFDRAYGGWGNSGLASALVLLLDFPTIILASILTGIADFALPWNEHMLSVLAGAVVLIVGPLQWLGIVALVRRAVATRREARASMR